MRIHRGNGIHGGLKMDGSGTKRSSEEMYSSLGKRLSFLMLLVAGVLFCPTLGHGQYRASLHGTITDPAGAVVSGATATLLDPATSQKAVATTDANGIYHFNALPPSTYQLTVNAGGFKQQVLGNINIIPEQANTLDVQLEVGKVEETVTV